MCCFSRPVLKVADTEIFCRMGDSGNQVVVYGMTLHAEEDLAMILPVPVVAEAGEDAVRFLDFAEYPDFFADLNRHFVDPLAGNFGPSRAGSLSDSQTLEVHRVGSFDASFVPTVADFSRLDERFRLPTAVWEGLPQYADHGFVVFKLRAGESKVHPMAFAYPARDRSRIVFPTVHIHDGEVHEKADFDHSLFVQEPAAEVQMEWTESNHLAMRFTNIPKTQGVVRPEHHLYRKVMKGEFDNADVVIAAGGQAA